MFGMMKKIVRKERVTKETQISLEINLRSEGESKVETGVGFFDHMLTAFAKHSGIDLTLSCDGDLQVDSHHTVEDCGIVLGQALHEAVFPLSNVERYGNAVVVMDEAAFSCDLDLSNRAFLVFESTLGGKIGDFDAELVEEFFRAVAFNAGFTVHLVELRGKNSHHKAEAAFKAFAVALRRALAFRDSGGAPSTKGTL